MPRLDGHEVTIEEKEMVIQPDKWRVYSGEGMPIRSKPSKKGDLHVQFKVSLPRRLSAEQLAIIETIL